MIVFGILNTLVFLAAMNTPYINMPPEEVMTHIASSDWTILDVRENTEYDAGHVPSAWLMPYSSKALTFLWTELPKDKPVIVYCRSGGRSVAASMFLAEQGFLKIYNMPGGFNAYSSRPDAPVEYPIPLRSIEIRSWMLYE